MALQRPTLLLALLTCTAGLLALAPAAGATCANTGLTSSAADEAQMTAAVTCLVNAERTARGLPALARDARLDTAARAHSADMAAQNYFDHDSLDGTGFSTRITNAGYSWVLAGENIAGGQGTAKSVMLTWMASKGHCRNILNGSFADIGVGLASGTGTYGTYWTQDFGRQSGADTPSSTADGCPFKSLVAGADSGTTAPGEGQMCGKTTNTKLRIDSVRRAARGKVRIAGHMKYSGCCPKMRFTVKRGRRSVKLTRKICRSKFVVKMRLPRARGKARITVKLTSKGPTAHRTLKL